MENEIVEHLIKTAEKVALSEKRYLAAKHELDLLKAQYILKNDWEQVLGVKKPTQKQKDAFVEIAVEEKVNEVNDLKLQLDYCKRIYEINILSQKY